MDQHETQQVDEAPPVRGARHEAVARREDS